MKNGEKKILSEKVADMLRAKIINGELQADSRIIESDVAKCMEVSRGPVREALKILEYEASGTDVGELKPVKRRHVFEGQ